MNKDGTKISFFQLTPKTKATNQTNSYKENNVHK